MVIDNSKFPPAYINPFMDKLYEWGYAEGLWDDKRELLQDLDGDAFPFESLKSFLIENDIPEWYYEGGGEYYRIIPPYISIGVSLFIPTHRNHYPPIAQRPIRNVPHL